MLYKAKTSQREVFCFVEAELLGKRCDLACGTVEGEGFAAVEHGKVGKDIWLIEAWQAKCVPKDLIYGVAVFIYDSVGEKVFANIGPYARTEWR